MVAVEVDSREAGREHVRTLATAGVDEVKAVYDSRMEALVADDGIRAIGEEADRQGLPLSVHVTTVADALTVLTLRVDRFVHPPFDGTSIWNCDGEALREQGCPCPRRSVPEPRTRRCDFAGLFQELHDAPEALERIRDLKPNEE